MSRSQWIWVQVDLTFLQVDWGIPASITGPFSSPPSKLIQEEAWEVRQTSHYSESTRCVKRSYPFSLWEPKRNSLHSIWCPREDLALPIRAGCAWSVLQKRQPSGAHDCEKKPRHPPLHVPGGGDRGGERDCWPQSFLSDKRHNCCRKPSTNQLYISENMWWIFHETIMPWGAQPFVWIQQVKASVVCSFLCEEFLGFHIVQNNHLARPPLKRSGVSSSTHPTGQSC